jgi:hypothetical protein
VRGPRRAHRRRRRRRAGGVGDVLANGAAEEHRFLRHDADGAAQVSSVRSRTSMSVERDAAAVTSQKRGSRAGDGGLAGAAAPTSATTSPGAIVSVMSLHHIGCCDGM